MAIIPVFDIPWTTAGGAPLTAIALRGEYIVGTDADNRHYVGRHATDSITTIAGPVTSLEAMEIVLRHSEPACECCQEGGER